MQSPLVIGLLSIIPGLGFFVLGKPRKGILVIGILLALLLLFLFVPIPISTGLGTKLYVYFDKWILIVYLFQIYLAVQDARMLKRQQAEKAT